MVANLLDIKNEDKQDLLETFDLKRRLDKVLEHLGERVGVLRISKEIGDKTKKEFDERQREHVLREQMRQIQKELGEGDETAAELEGLKKAIEDAGMPRTCTSTRSRSSSACSAWARAPRLDAQDLPRMAGGAALEGIKVQEIDIAKARANPGRGPLRPRQDQAPHPRAPRGEEAQPRGQEPDPVLRRAPGVGKTSLGQSIARATGRKFQRIALGGVHDEAEIRGHRRTYIGALPGNVIQAIRRAESRSCVLMFDEIDKLGQGGFHGDPSSALLEVLDPEQNSKFRDNYLAVDFDLSKIMFITTANMLDTIPGPLRDRMEIIQLPGYTEEEKLEIAKRYLVKRQLDANGLKAEQATLPEDTLRAMIRDYTREAGRAHPGARDRRGAEERGDEDRRRRQGPIAVEPKDLHDPGRGAEQRSPSAPRCRAWPPASPGPRSAATSCSSRRRARAPGG